MFFANLGQLQTPHHLDSAVHSCKSLFAFYQSKIKTHAQLVFVVADLLRSPLHANPGINSFLVRLLGRLVASTFSFESAGPGRIPDKPQLEAQLTSECSLMDLVVFLDLAVKNAQELETLNEMMIHFCSDPDFSDFLFDLSSKYSYFLMHFNSRSDFSSLILKRSSLSIPLMRDSATGRFRLFRGPIGDKFVDYQIEALTRPYREGPWRRFGVDLVPVVDSFGNAHILFLQLTRLSFIKNNYMYLLFYLEKPDHFRIFLDQLLKLDLVRFCASPFGSVMSSNLVFLFVNQLDLTVRNYFIQLFSTFVKSEAYPVEAYRRFLALLVEYLRRLVAIEQGHPSVKQLGRIQADLFNFRLLSNSFLYLLFQNFAFGFDFKAFGCGQFGFAEIGRQMLDTLALASSRTARENPSFSVQAEVFSESASAFQAASTSKEVHLEHFKSGNPTAFSKYQSRL